MTENKPLRITGLEQRKDGALQWELPSSHGSIHFLIGYQEAKGNHGQRMPMPFSLPQCAVPQVCQDIPQNVFVALGFRL